MSFGHKKLHVYQAALEYVAWMFGHAEELSGTHRHARGQWIRAAQSIPLNIAEGNGKYTGPDRKRFFAIARGSALECAAIQDVLQITQGVDAAMLSHGEKLLVRIVSMLSKMPGPTLRETTHVIYGTPPIVKEVAPDEDL